MNHVRRAVLPLTVSLALVAYLLHRVALREIAAAVMAVPLGLWALALGLYLVAQVVSSHRWAILARTLGFEQSPGRFLRLYSEGMFFNLCLPTSVGGDVVKAVRLGDTAPRRLLAGCTVLADRVAGLAAIATLGTAAALYALLLRRGCGAIASAGSAFLAGAALFAVLAGGWRFGHAAVRGLPKVGKLVAAIEPYYDRPRVAARAYGLSLVIQLLNVAVVACLGTALGLSLPPVAYCVAVPGAAVLTALPVSLGGIGMREASMTLLLSPWDVPPAACVALGVLWFSVMIAASLLGGVAFLASLKATPADAVAFQSPRGPRPHLPGDRAERPVCQGQ